MATLKETEVRDFLESLNGKMFGVDFIKRSDGTLRKMLATTNYESHLAGGEAKYDSKAKGLLVVWSLDSKGFRSIPLNNVQVIRAKGQVFTIEH
jgi:hypothetical protein